MPRCGSAATHPSQHCSRAGSGVGMATLNGNKEMKIKAGKIAVRDKDQYGWGFWHPHPDAPLRMSRPKKDGSWEFREPTEDETRFFNCEPGSPASARAGT